jgi:hypothetical protein
MLILVEKTCPTVFCVIRRESNPSHLSCRSRCHTVWQMFNAIYWCGDKYPQRKERTILEFCSCQFSVVFIFNSVHPVVAHPLSSARTHINTTASVFFALLSLPFVITPFHSLRHRSSFFSEIYRARPARWPRAKWGRSAPKNNLLLLPF